MRYGERRTSKPSLKGVSETKLFMRRYPEKWRPREAVGMIRRGLQEDDTLIGRTDLLPGSIAELLELCLRYTYFCFKGKFYEQREGVAMGSPV